MHLISSDLLIIFRCDSENNNILIDMFLFSSWFRAQDSWQHFTSQFALLSKLKSRNREAELKKNEHSKSLIFRLKLALYLTPMVLDEDEEEEELQKNA